MNIICCLLVAASVVLASAVLSPIVSEGSLVWYLAAVAGLVTFLCRAIHRRVGDKR
jgi:hypothetical protein